MGDSDVVIRVEGLGKKYSLHHEKSERYTALRDVVARQAKAAGRLLNPFTLAGQLRKGQREAAAERAETEEEFWALKDVSFEIRRGERVGIIGRNGAGKSTLLKILSRITEPTTGRVEIRGRVASLLEVGTGFHPELTGRENVYLNGAILGMTRREIRSKFDQIVDFAEVEKFLDTPVKRYSSGMYVRLAFAVAAHLEPEILVVDEVLAVGDASFQSKSIAKLDEFSADTQRTVLVVSHQLQIISSICKKSMLLSNGRIQCFSETSEVIREYSLASNQGSALTDYSDTARPGDSRATLIKAWIENKHGRLIEEADIEDEILVSFIYEVHETSHGTPYPNLHVFNEQGICAFVVHGSVNPSSAPKQTRYKATFQIPPNLLNTGTYTLGVAVTFSANETHVSFYQSNELSIRMKENILSNPMRAGSGFYGSMPGCMRPLLPVNITHA